MGIIFVIAISMIYMQFIILDPNQWYTAKQVIIVFQ